MTSNKTDRELNVHNIIFSFIPTLIAIIIPFIINLGDIIVLFIAHIFSDQKTDSSLTAGEVFTQAYNQPMNLAFISLFQFLAFVIIFGFWYKNTFYQKGEIIKKPTIYILIIFAGIAGQFFTDSILSLLRPIFTKAFKEYDAIVSSVTGVTSSWVLLLAVMIVAPIGEELLFRGLTQKYALRCFSPTLAIIFQATLFSLYHGNIIQCVYAFIFGLILGLLAHHFQSILPGILLHISINSSIFLVPQKLLASTGTCTITAIISGITLTLCLLICLRKDKA